MLKCFVFIKTVWLVLKGMFYKAVNFVWVIKILSVKSQDLGDIKILLPEIFNVQLTCIINIVYKTIWIYIILKKNVFQ